MTGLLNRHAIFLGLIQLRYDCYLFWQRAWESFLGLTMNLSYVQGPQAQIAEAIKMHLNVRLSSIVIFAI